MSLKRKISWLPLQKQHLESQGAPTFWFYNNKSKILQFYNLAKSGISETVQHASFAVPTCCRRDQGGERPSPGYCPAWCYDKGSGPSAAPLLAGAGCAVDEGAASQKEAGMLQIERKKRIIEIHSCTWNMPTHTHTHKNKTTSVSCTGSVMEMPPHFVVYPAACSVKPCPCPPTLPWP